MYVDLAGLGGENHRLFTNLQFSSLFIASEFFSTLPFFYSREAGYVAFKMKH